MPAITISITPDDGKAAATLTIPAALVKAIRDWMATQVVTPGVPGIPEIPATETSPAIPAVPAVPATLKYKGIRALLALVIADAIDSRWKGAATSVQIANKRAALEAARADLDDAVNAQAVTTVVPNGA